MRTGCETRSPLYDARVLAFMADRPREDRATAGVTKVLLRRAMQGLLPPEHLAPREKRTGLPGSYLRRNLRESLPRWWAGLTDGLRLADLGLVEPKKLKLALDGFLTNVEWDTAAAVGLFDVIGMEHWLRVHDGTGVAG